VVEFLVESYVPRADQAGAELGAARAREAADRLAREGVPIRFLRSIFVPEDETCFYLYEAASVEDVREAANRAALSFERVAKAIPESKSSGRGDR
jgi:Nickel responsive protein SCO4226-like